MRIAATVAFFALTDEQERKRDERDRGESDQTDADHRHDGVAG